TPDSTQFVVHRIILSLASPIWKDMFSIPQPPDSGQNPLPIIPVEEDPQTLETLLTVIYPLPSPRISSYDEAIKLVQACDKYFIDTSRLDTVLHKVLRTKAALEADPLGVYALAWRLGLEEEAITASRYTHLLDLNDPSIKSELLRRSGSADPLLALWDLRLQREKALDTFVRVAEIKYGPEMFRSSSPQCYRHSSDYRAYGWGLQHFLDVKSTVRLSLQCPYPTCHTLKEFFGISFLAEEYGCGECQARMEAKHNELVRMAQAALSQYPQTITR
ncbi:hypothetical protein FRB90_000648, partial [Tulasnella sp. 427]